MMEKLLPSIPVKRYFTIGEVSDLCGVKPYVLRYWEQEFSQLRPMKRRGNRRYYQHHEVLLIRRIRELLYDEGFTISGARNRLSDLSPARESLMTSPVVVSTAAAGPEARELDDGELAVAIAEVSAARAPGFRTILSKIEASAERPVVLEGPLTWSQVRDELISIRSLLV
jgi:DNA-binding transcriptional MerR regulator